MSVTGPSFLALQVRDLERAAAFYEGTVGLTRAPVAPPGAVVFATTPIAFAVRTPLPGVDLDTAAPRPGYGVALWLPADDAQALHDHLAAADVPVLAAPSDGPGGEPGRSSARSADRPSGSASEGSGEPGEPDRMTRSTREPGTTGTRPVRIASPSPSGSGSGASSRPG